MKPTSKELRRLNHLFGIVHPPYIRKSIKGVGGINEDWDLDKQLTTFTGYLSDRKKIGGGKGYEHLDNIVELLTLSKKLKFSNDELLSLWNTKWNEHKEKKDEYSLKPIRERKDNKDVINYGSGGNGSSNVIRYPKKVRKTAWKRFYKLFPKLDPKNNKQN